MTSPGRTRRGRLGVGAIVVIVIVVGIGRLTEDPHHEAKARVEAVTHADVADLAVVPERVRVGGYDRQCGADRGCVFGPAWSDDVDVEFGRDGCDTRNNVLGAQLRDVTIRSGTSGCVVLSGTLDEPYAGKIVDFVRGPGNTVSIDHIYPLAAAWDLGAHAWTDRQRRNFANDPLNLLATTVSINSSKGDQTPGQWSPISPEGACLYASRYVAVAATYDLPVTPDDAAALSLTLSTCES